MIIVSGTKRSGTSMWMQIIVAAGFPPIGEKFPRNWEQSLRDANPNGFWESTLREGVNFTTNPNPDTGAYVRPEQVATHAVKIFADGLARTDLAYVGRVVATIRGWRAHAESMQRLWALEDAKRSKPPPPRLHPTAEWFAHNFNLLGDSTLRGYPIRVSAYEDLTADPRSTIESMLAWLGGGDVEAAVATVTTPRHEAPEPGPDDPPYAEACDILYEALRSGRPLALPARQKLAAAHQHFTGELERFEAAIAEHRAAQP